MLNKIKRIGNVLGDKVITNLDVISMISLVSVMSHSLWTLTPNIRNGNISINNLEILISYGLTFAFIGSNFFKENLKDNRFSKNLKKQELEDKKNYFSGRDYDLQEGDEEGFGLI